MSFLKGQRSRHAPGLVSCLLLVAGGLAPTNCGAHLPAAAVGLVGLVRVRELKLV